MAGFSSITGQQSIMFADNCSFDGTMRGGAMTTNGQLWIGSTASPHVILGSLTSPLSTITIGYSSPNITIDINGSKIGETITGNSGGALSPTAGNWNILGSSIVAGTTPVTTVGSGSTLTIEVQKSQAIASTNASNVGLAAFNSSQFTVDANGFVALSGTGPGLTITGNSGGALSPTAGNWNIFGSSVAAGTTPVATSGTGSTLTVNVQRAQAIASTNATNIGLAAFNSAQFTVDANGFVSTSGSAVTLTLTGNTGGAISPSAGNINTVGTGSITIAGAGSTLTTQLTGLTNHAVLVGAGTATITNVGPTATAGQVLQSQGSTTDPAFSTATYPSTTTINQILYSSAANVVSGLATANDGVLTTGTTGIPVITALSANGQLIIGSGSGAPIAATLTPGAGITITNAANSITIAETNPSGFPWTDVTGATQTLAVNNGYVTDHTNVTYTLPASGVLGDTIIIVGKLGITTISQNANQQILMGSASSTVGVGGSVAGTNVGDCITLICITAGASTVWRAKSFVGNWTVT
jgi:hypothetical protein